MQVKFLLRIRNQKSRTSFLLVLVTYHALMNLSSIDLFFMFSAAYDPLDPTGNITMKWDVVSWTADGYVVSLCLIVIFPSILDQILW